MRPSGRLPSAGCSAESRCTSALTHAAEHRIVHRDVKPANIMLTRSGEPKLCDLGLAISKRDEAKITSAGMIMGTPFYLSPEQARNEQLDERSDLYSLGATLFHTVTGSVPYDGDSPASIVARHWTDPVPDPRFRVGGLSEDFALLIMRLLAKDPEERYQSCEELMADLLELKKSGSLAPNSQTRAGRLVPGEPEPVVDVAAEQAKAVAEAVAAKAAALELERTQSLESSAIPVTSPAGEGGLPLAALAGAFVVGLVLGVVVGMFLSAR